MRIGLDIRPFLSRETGVGTYLRNLLFELARTDRTNEYFLLSSSWKDRFPAEKIPPFAAGRFRDLRVPVRVLNFFWQRLGWPPFAAAFGAAMDLTHSPTPLPLPGRGRKIVTVYDLFFLESPRKADREARLVFSRRIGAALRRADGILTISDFTRASILELFDIDPDKILVTPLGVDPAFFEDASPGLLEDARRRLDLPPRFLLFVGAAEPRKNLVALIEALDLVHRDGDNIPLVIVGREGEDTVHVRKAVAGFGLETSVKFLGYLPDSEVRLVYRLATLMVLPSLCEGFGLPLLEAMASGTPAAVSRAGALPEVGGDAAAYFEPEQASRIARKILELLGNPAALRTLGQAGRARAAHFSWGETARRTLAFYERIGGAR
jgi:glycosyltransferase involved in cell wall biosynthesis